ncbi:MAG: hypothetical protein OEQ53_08330 [Saprospiraceae bacterium]|nr:hypothetical protein [Saprospiraceae bacterium]
MKTITSVSILLSLGLFSVQSAAQSKSQSHSELTQEFQFDKSSDEKEVELEVHTGTKMVGFEFMSEIAGGHLIMTILDPNGKKESGFELEAIEKEKGDGSNRTSSTNQNSDDNSHTYTMVHTDGGKASGMLNKQIENPIAGTWKVKIKAKGLSGLVALKIHQMSDD